MRGNTKDPSKWFERAHCLTACNVVTFLVGAHNIWFVWVLRSWKVCIETPVNNGLWRRLLREIGLRGKLWHATGSSGDHASHKAQRPFSNRLPLEVAARVTRGRLPLTIMYAQEGAGGDKKVWCKYGSDKSPLFTRPHLATTPTGVRRQTQANLV